MHKIKSLLKIILLVWSCALRQYANKIDFAVKQLFTRLQVTPRTNEHGRKLTKETHQSIECSNVH